ncbi:hypothetical protein AVEN_177840-1 [Araneus ventricosus]|uniref:Uncharacterized protein n=1 Tax=Araneus ventricosus TaxID=182803 RepID=A0A4Y2TH48_ARAVE|nr:hypothetical protein AVEN_177840-1 [Araneus ventricosus]
MENMPHNIDRMALSNDQQYLYDICLAISRGECYSDLTLRKPGPVVHSRWLTIAVSLRCFPSVWYAHDFILFQKAAFNEFASLGFEYDLAACVNPYSKFCKEVDDLIMRLAAYDKEITESDECK